jgi:hypothetical protein
MPVRKYRSVEEMGDTASVDPRSADLARIMRDLWAFTSRLAPAVSTRGVRKFRSVEELDRFRAAHPPANPTPRQ